MYFKKNEKKCDSPPAYSYQPQPQPQDNDNDEMNPQPPSSTNCFFRGLQFFYPGHRRSPKVMTDAVLAQTQYNSLADMFKVREPEVSHTCDLGVDCVFNGYTPAVNGRGGTGVVGLAT